MTAKERVLARERERGRAAAQEVQTNAPGMTGTELYAVNDRIPAFAAVCGKGNLLDRPAGFVCRSPAGRVVKLLQPYDSAVYTAPPEELPALWGFVWSTDPDRALPFIALATSPYNTGDCCVEEGRVYRSLTEGNVYPPSAWPGGWEAVV